MRNFLALVLLMLPLSRAMALNFTLSEKLNANEKAILTSAMNEAGSILPENFQKKLSHFSVSVSNFNGQKLSPETICAPDPNRPSFTYGKYEALNKELVLNRALLSVLSQGKEKSSTLPCHHGSLYEQAIATIIHELGHIYDLNSGTPSSKEDFLNLALFKKGLFGEKNLNKDPLRSPDVYETSDSREAFAVNLEYFLLDSEFSCRRPSLNRYFRKLLQHNPFPGQNCKMNRQVMISAPHGLIPVELDPSRIYRVDYLLASKGTQIMSRFGHSMFRIVMCAPGYHNPVTDQDVPPTPFGPECLKDKIAHLVVSYRANASNSTVNYLKGVFGGYASQLYILTFPSVVEEYNRTELRDLLSYPMKLTASQKTEFLDRVVEEHWQYRGSYKFFTRNCATESARSIRNILIETNGSEANSITPNGVRKDFASSGLIDENNFEILKTKSEYLIDAYCLVYKNGRKNCADYKGLQKFINSSTVEDRSRLFADIIHQNGESKSLQSLLQKKKAIVKLASCSMLENQIIRVKGSVLQKKIAEMVKDPKTLEKSPELKQILKDVGEVSEIETPTAGYGIPSREELEKVQAKNNSAEVTATLKKQIEDLIKKTFPKETADLNELTENLVRQNDEAMKFRETFRNELKTYALLNLKRLGAEKDIKTVREFLGSELYTSKEVSDETLRKWLAEAL